MLLQEGFHPIVLSFDLRGTPWHLSFNIHHHLSFFVTALLGIDLQKKESNYQLHYYISLFWVQIQHEAPYYLGSLQGSNAKNIEYFACSNKKAVVWIEYLQFSLLKWGSISLLNNSQRFLSLLPLCRTSRASSLTNLY